MLHIKMVILLGPRSQLWHKLSEKFELRLWLEVLLLVHARIPDLCKAGICILSSSLGAIMLFELYSVSECSVCCVMLLLSSSWCDFLLLMIAVCVLSPVLWRCFQFSLERWCILLLSLVLYRFYSSKKKKIFSIFFIKSWN